MHMKKFVLLVILFFGVASFLNAQVICNFEDGTTGPLTLHVMGCGDWDNVDLHPVSETFEIVDNPDQSGINTSAKVLKFTRRGTDNGGLPWGGFWAGADPNLDVTANKIVHYKAWKPRISPLKFKLEGGATGTYEIFSVAAQTLTNAWEEFAFDFTANGVSGDYPTVALMPDFEDPLTITGDIVIYIDDIYLSNSTSPSGLNDPAPSEFAIYPNPVQSTLYISNMKNVNKIVVSNIIGQSLIQVDKITANYIEVNVSNLLKGLYIVTVYDQYGNASARKFMKE